MASVVNMPVGAHSHSHTFAPYDNQGAAWRLFCQACRGGRMGAAGWG